MLHALTIPLDFITLMSGGKKLNGTHQLLVFADDMNLLGDNIDTMKKNTETLIGGSKEVGLEVNQRKLSICCCLITILQGKIIT
jgi:hypothetical protein